MGLPTFVGKGAKAASTGAITPPLPAGIATDDILKLVIETADSAITIPTPNGGTWTEVTDSPQGTSGQTRLTTFWSRYNGTQGAPTTSDSGNHQIGAIYAFRGCITTGDPWSVTSGNVDATSDDSLSATGATTVDADCLVVIAAVLDHDARDFGATWTNADLANITVRGNDADNVGNRGRVGLVTGEKASIGAYGATTNTLNGNSLKGMMTIALKPPAAPGGVDQPRPWQLKGQMGAILAQ